MQTIGDKSNTGRAGKHGLFRLLPQRMKIDGRTKFGRAVSDLRNSLTTDLGECLSTQKALLVDRIIFKVLKLCSYEAHSLKGDDSSMKCYLAMANSLRLDLQSLGLERREMEPEDLKKYLAQNYPGPEEGENG